MTSLMQMARHRRWLLAALTLVAVGATIALLWTHARRAAEGALYSPYHFVDVYQAPTEAQAKGPPRVVLERDPAATPDRGVWEIAGDARDMRFTEEGLKVVATGPDPRIITRCDINADEVDTVALTMAVHLRSTGTVWSYPAVQVFWSGSAEGHDFAEERNNLAAAGEASVASLRGSLESWIRALPAFEPAARPGTWAIDKATKERLRALGYVEQ